MSPMHSLSMIELPHSCLYCTALKTVWRFSRFDRIIVIHILGVHDDEAENRSRRDSRHWHAAVHLRERTDGGTQPSYSACLWQGWRRDSPDLLGTRFR